MSSSSERLFTQTAQEYAPTPGHAMRLPTDLSTSASFRFFDLPGELRNAVYELLVVEEDEIDICRKLPRIAQVSRQLRDESLAVYLGRNRFLATQVPDRCDFLIHWLATIGSQSLQYLKLLSIECVINYVFASEAGAHKFPSLRVWHELVVCLRAFDVRPSQLRFTWARMIDPQIVGQKHFVYAKDAHFFAKYALSPLLKDHGLLQNTPTMDVLADLAKEFNSTASDSNIRECAQDAITVILSIEETLELNPGWYTVLRQEYFNYLGEIFTQAEGMLGRFYDLKYLHERRGIVDHRHTSEFQDAFKAAIDLHRNRHWHKRDWSISGTRAIYRAFESQGHMLYGKASIKPSFSPTANPPQKEGSPPSTAIAMNKNGTAASTFGSVGSMSPRPNLGRTVVTDEKSPFDTTSTDGESPFATLPVLAKDGALFSALFSTKGN